MKAQGRICGDVSFFPEAGCPFPFSFFVYRRSSMDQNTLAATNDTARHIPLEIDIRLIRKTFVTSPPDSSSLFPNPSL